MPIYEYQCEDGHRFEVIQSFSDEDLTECRECGARVKRLISPPAIHFKGKGFHNTDYGKGNRRRAGEGDSASDSNGDGAGASGASESSSESSSSSDSSSNSSSSGDKSKAKD